jgi:hypothetical protein
MEPLSSNSKSMLKKSNNDLSFYKENNNRIPKNSFDLNKAKSKPNKIEIQNVFLENCINLCKTFFLYKFK